MFFPLIEIVPSSHFKIPVMHLIVVVFPAPLGPKNPKICPFLTLKLSLFKAL